MSRPTRAGITLTEVVVVIAIVAITIGLLLPATRRVGPAGERTACQNNLKQLSFAQLNYQISHDTDPATQADAPSDGAFPTGCVGPGKTPEARLSWMVELLPYIEQDTLYKQFDATKGFDGNIAPARASIRTYLCPSAIRKDRPLDDTTYVALSGIGLDAATRPAGADGIGFMGYDRRTSVASITDGTSNTIALAETRLNLGPWARGGTSTLRGFDPADLPLIGENRPFGVHTGGVANVAMADGSVRIISKAIDPTILAAAITIAGGEPAEAGTSW